MPKTYPALICAALVVSGAAYAQTKPAAGNDAITLGTPATDLSAAVTAAEKHVNGKAVRAEYERRQGGAPVYDVEVVAGGKVFDIKVDATKGTVIASAEDKADSDDQADSVD